jgi:hypothetical protein
VHKILLAGAILAAVVAALVGFGDAFGLDVSRFALLGSTVGAVLGLGPSGAPVQRAGAWAVGVLVTWLGYAARLTLLPDTASGRAVAAACVVLTVAVVAAVSYRLLPLWALLLGVASLAGAYEITFTGAPATFSTDALTAVTALALATAVGFLATTLMVRAVPAAETSGPDRAGGSVPGPRHAEPDLGLGLVDWTRSEA